MTNEQLVTDLIEAATYVGKLFPNSTESLRTRVSRAKEAVLERMRPETEAIPGAQGETVHLDSLPGTKIEGGPLRNSSRIAYPSPRIREVPTCPICGHDAVPNGLTCKCLNCGESFGIS